MILFLYLNCIETWLILPCIDHLFLLHVSRANWFQTKCCVLSFSVYRHFFICSLKIKTFQAWCSKMPSSLRGIINDNTETSGLWDMSFVPFRWVAGFCSHHAVDFTAFWLFANFLCLGCIVVLNVYLHRVSCLVRLTEDRLSACDERKKRNAPSRKRMSWKIPDLSDPVQACELGVILALSLMTLQRVPASLQVAENPEVYSLRSCR